MDAIESNTNILSSSSFLYCLPIFDDVGRIEKASIKSIVVCNNSPSELNSPQINQYAQAHHNPVCASMLS